MTTIEILLTIGVATFIVFAVFNIIYILDVRKTSISLRHFIAKTEESLLPALDELKNSLREIRKVSEDIGLAVDKVHATVERIAGIEKNFLSLYLYYKQHFGQTAHANMEGVKAGVRAGFSHLLKNFRRKKGES